jgi:hypothetical protein
MEKEEDFCRSERKEETVVVSGVGVGDWWWKKQWLFQGWGWATGGWASYLWWSWWCLWSVAGAGKRGRERKKLQKQGVDGLVLADFKLIFFPTQAMKSTPIYRG